MQMKANPRTDDAAHQIRKLGERVAGALEGKPREHLMRTETPDRWVDCASSIAAIRELELELENARRVIAERMRGGGASWAMVGDALRMTKQGAQQRYGL